MSFIYGLLYNKKTTCLSKLACSLGFSLIFFFFFTACNPSSKFSASKFPLTEEERTLLKDFFTDLLFEHDGAYTLHGSKPVTSSVIYHITEEFLKKVREQNNLLSEQEKSEMVVRRSYNYDSSYQKWQEVKSRFVITQYLFGTFTSPYENIEYGLLVNIEETLKILLKYYEDFRRILGYDFDPMQVVFEVENKDSLFWNKVLSHSGLLGILLGYGRENAWFFRWWAEQREEKGQKEAFFHSLPFKFDDPRRMINFSPQDFLLPSFRNYGVHPNKRLTRQYKKEQKRIKALYKGQDIVDVALECLTR